MSKHVSAEQGDMFGFDMPKPPEVSTWSPGDAIVHPNWQGKRPGYVVRIPNRWHADVMLDGIGEVRALQASLKRPNEPIESEPDD